MNVGSDRKNQRVKESLMGNEQMRAIAYSMDALIPGLYIWLGTFKIRLGGSLPEPSYPGTLHSLAGIELVLPRYRSTRLTTVAMTLDKHKIDGVPQITSRTMPTEQFNKLLTQAGCTKIGTAPAQGNRIKSWWTHSMYAKVEVIYSPDEAIAITA